MYHRRNRCILCDSNDVPVVISLNPSPIAEGYFPAERHHHTKTSYPLDVALCGCCGHVQLLDVIEPAILFGSDYFYRTGAAVGMKEHFACYAHHVRTLTGVDSGLVVDIGSNDGTLLKEFAARGHDVCGVDSAPHIARKAAMEGVETLPRFFDREVADAIRRNWGCPTIVTANNVFGHNEDLSGMADAVRLLLADDGIFVFEVAYLLDMLNGMSFDAIYHEHLSYHSVVPLASFLERHGLKLFHVENIPVKGGSIRCYAQKSDTGRQPANCSVAAAIATEEQAKLFQEWTYAKFMAVVTLARDRTIDWLLAHTSLVVGYGASTSVTTLLHHFAMNDHLSFLVDDNEAKWGLLSPGLGIEVRSPGACKHASRGIVLAWRFADRILKTVPKGMEWFVPLPVPRVVRT